MGLAYASTSARASARGNAERWSREPEAVAERVVCARRVVVGRERQSAAAGTARMDVVVHSSMPEAARCKSSYGGGIGGVEVIGRKEERERE